MTDSRTTWAKCGCDTCVTKRTNTKRRAGVLSPTCCARCTLCCCACRCTSCHNCPHWSWRCCCRHTILRSHFVRDFLYQEMYSLHPPSVTVNCVDCYRINHCNFCTKFFVRLMPHINRRFTDFSGFHRSISVKSIVAVMSQMRDATKKFAIATTRRRSFATNFGSTLCPLLSWSDAM